MSAKRPTPLALESFLPYRLAILSELVSGSIAHDYQQRFDLSIPQWRVMAILGRHPGITATEVGERSAMDKVPVSRAVAALERAGRVRREPDPDDARRVRLWLTARGRAVYQRIVPIARSFERDLLADLDPDERDALERLLPRLTRSALALSARRRGERDSPLWRDLAGEPV